MNKEKQIDEMAKLICNFPQCINYNSMGECKPTECQIADKAEALYNAGYRKQSNLIEEFVDKLKMKLSDNQLIFTQQRYIVVDEIDKLEAEMKGGE